MKNGQVRLHLIVYVALLPYTAGAAVLGTIQIVLSFFLTGEQAETVRIIGYSVFLVLLLFGVLQALRILWKTRKLE